METYNEMEGLVSSAQNDPTTDKFLLAKNAMQLKVVQEFMRKNNSLDPDHDYESFILFSRKYGEVIQHIVIEHPDLAQRVLVKVEKDPDAPIEPADLAEIEELLKAPNYSQYLH